MNTVNRKPLFSAFLTRAAAAGFLLLPCSLITATPTGSDWPTWGGDNGDRNMYSPAKNLPDHFDVGKFKSGTEDVDPATTKNVKWVATLGSQAFGNVVVSHGK